MQIDWFPLWLSLRVAGLATVVSLAAGLWLDGLMSAMQRIDRDKMEAVFRKKDAVGASALMREVIFGSR